MTTKLAIILLLTFLGGCVGNAPARLEGSFSLTPATETALQDYLHRVFPTRRGAVAVSEDGADSYYAYCPEFSCAIPNYAAFVLRQCKSLSGQACQLLYINSDPRLGYRVDTQRTEPGKHGSYKDIVLEFEWFDF